MEESGGTTLRADCSTSQGFHPSKPSGAGGAWPRNRLITRRCKVVMVNTGALHHLIIGFRRLCVLLQQQQVVSRTDIWTRIQTGTKTLQPSTGTSSHYLWQRQVLQSASECQPRHAAAPYHTACHGSRSARLFHWHASLARVD
ncbi:hypothetical protein TgHK011_004096 [Trichoderma gracile]|nr:hypothetical protein TgHK011_004096 [Trichoderma gracile]